MKSLDKVQLGQWWLVLTAIAKVRGTCSSSNTCASLSSADLKVYSLDGCRCCQLLVSVRLLQANKQEVMIRSMSGYSSVSSSLQSDGMLPEGGVAVFGHAALRDITC